MGSIRDEIGKRLGLTEKRDPQQLLKGAIEDQEKQKQIERRSEGPGETDKENNRLLWAAQAADRGQLRTAARILRGSRQRKRRLMRLNNSTKRAVKPKNGRMMRLREPRIG